MRMLRKQSQIFSTIELLARLVVEGQAQFLHDPEVLGSVPRTIFSGVTDVSLWRVSTP